MSCLKVKGGRRLNGEAAIQGAKNAVLPILAAAVMGRNETVIRNCPDLTDVRAALEILESAGCKTKFSENTVVVDSRNADSYIIPDELMLKMRSSVIFCGGLLSVFKRAEISQPGGCELGARPVDLHLKAFKSMGAEITEAHGRIICDGSNMHSEKIYLDFPSVGATENIMLASVYLPGTTTIVNAAKEPEIVDLQEFINNMGGRVFGAGTSIVTIEGTSRLYDAEYTVMPDRIVTATYMAAVAASGGRALLKNTVYPHVEAVGSVLADCGCRIEDCGNEIIIASDRRPLGAGRITTSPYPGFPTDAQAIIMAAVAKAEGMTVISENIFDSRYKHVPELLRMGASVMINGKTAVVTGVKELCGARVFASDLRGGAALAVAACGAVGESVIENIHFIDRGYECIERDFSMLGADFVREEDFDE